MTAFFFYLFSAVTVGSGFMVIASRNPVHSVLFLILAFVNAAGLFLLLGAEFLAMILVVVYVGAVAVLFLFVVMMLDVDFAELRQGFLQYLPIGGLVGLVLLIEILLVVSTWVAPTLVNVAVVVPGPAVASGQAGMVVANTVPALTNTEMLGRVLYTNYSFFFEAAGLVLLVAMLGAIVLTLRERVGVRRQNIAEQVARTPEEAVQLRKVPLREGLKEGA